MTRLRVPGRKFARRALRPLSRLLFPGAAVLGYHRVADPEWDPLGLAVRPEYFAAHIEAVARDRTIVSLGELVELQAEGRPLNRYATLTFDDGYRDFKNTALPILEDRGEKATVFVSTGYIGGNFWWDEIASLLAPVVGSATALGIDAGAGEQWEYDGLESPGPRAAAARDICNKLVCSHSHDIQHVIQQLSVWAGVRPEPGYGAMTASDLAALSRYPGIEIGAHTVSHGCLGSLDEAEQRREIGQSKQDLEVVAGVDAAVFSYPNGSFSSVTPALMKPLGFRCACTSREGLFGRRTDPYRVPRLWVPNLPGTEFRPWFERVAGRAG